MGWKNWNHSAKGAFIGGICGLILGLISIRVFFYKYLSAGNQIVDYAIYHILAVILFGVFLGSCIGKLIDRKKNSKKENKTYAVWGAVIGGILSLLPPLTFVTGYLTEFLLLPLTEVAIGLFGLSFYIMIILLVLINIFFGASIGGLVGSLIKK